MLIFNYYAGRQTKVIISHSHPLPENLCGGNLTSKHPSQGGENKTGRDGRDPFLCFLKEKNNDKVWRRGSARDLCPHLQGLVVDEGWWEVLWLSVGIVSLADYKTQVWSCGLGRPWLKLLLPGPLSLGVRDRKFCECCRNRMSEKPGLTSQLWVYVGKMRDAMYVFGLVWLTECGLGLRCSCLNSHQPLWWPRKWDLTVGGAGCASALSSVYSNRG